MLQPFLSPLPLWRRNGPPILGVGPEVPAAAGLHSPVSHTSFQKDINTRSMWARWGETDAFALTNCYSSAGAFASHSSSPLAFVVCVSESSTRLQAAPWVSEPCLCVIGEAPTSWGFLSSTCKICALSTLCRARAEKPFPNRACVLLALTVCAFMPGASGKGGGPCSPRLAPQLGGRGVHRAPLPSCPAGLYGEDARRK